jgi:hypothetical protein
LRKQNVDFPRCSNIYQGQCDANTSAGGRQLWQLALNGGRDCSLHHLIRSLARKIDLLHNDLLRAASLNAGRAERRVAAALSIASNLLVIQLWSSS